MLVASVSLWRRLSAQIMQHCFCVNGTERQTERVPWGRKGTWRTGWSGRLKVGVEGDVKVSEGAVVMLVKVLIKVLVDVLVEVTGGTEEPRAL